MTRPHAPDAPAVAKKPGLKISPKLVWNAVRGHPYLTALTVVMAGTVGALVWVFMPLPKYTAYVVYQIAGRQIGPAGAVSDQVDLNSYKQRQAARVKYRMVLNNALNDPEFPTLRAAVESKAKGDPIDWLVSNLQVDTRTGTEFMRVYLEGDNPDELGQIIKAVNKAYRAGLDTQENSERNLQIDMLEKSIADQAGEIEKTQIVVDNIAKKLNAFDALSLAADERRLDDDLQTARRDIGKITRQLEGAISNRDLLADVNAVSPTDAQIDDEVAHDRQMQEAEGRVKALQAGLDALKKQLSEGAPGLVKPQADLKEAVNARDKLKIELRPKAATTLREGVEKDRKIKFDRAKELVDQLEKQLGEAERYRIQIENKIREHGASRLELEKAKEKIAHLKEWHTTMLREREKMKVGARVASRVSVAEEHVMPGVEGNRRVRNAAMAGAGVLLAGLGGLVGWEVRRRRLTRSDELATALGLPLLGTIPPAAAGIEASGELVEAVDSARTVLLHGDPSDRPLRTLVVTSALPGEGKTSLSGHLAISLARAGYRTLIVDGDVHSPSIHQVFDLDAGPGLCELLRDEAGMDEVIRPTRVPGVSVLPAGRWSLSTRQALVGDRWSAVRRQLEKQYDYVVIDTAPLLLMTDSLLLARNADGVILSALLGVTQMNSVAETQTRLNSLGARILGVIVNGARSPYSLRYGYGYGRYKPVGDETAPAVDGPNSLTPA